MTQEDKARYGFPEEDTNSYLPLIALKSDRDGAPAMLGDVVTDARDQFTQSGKPAVGITMNGLGARQWDKITGDIAKTGNTVAIVLDDTVYSDATARQPISGGQTEISGSFSLNETKDLANVLRAGKLPASADIIQSEVVGPSLGDEAINSGILSFLLAFFSILMDDFLLWKSWYLCKYCISIKHIINLRYFSRIKCCINITWYCWYCINNRYVC